MSKISFVVAMFAAAAAHAGTPDICSTEQQAQAPIQQSQQQMPLVGDPSQQEQAQQAQVGVVCVGEVIEQVQVPVQQEQEQCEQDQQQQGVPAQQQAPAEQAQQGQEQAQQAEQQQGVPAQQQAPVVATQTQVQRHGYISYQYTSGTGIREILSARVTKRYAGADYGYLRIEVIEGEITRSNLASGHMKLILRHSIDNGQIVGTTGTLEVDGNIILNDVPLVSVLRH